MGLSVFTGLGIGGATGLGFIIVQYSIPQQFMGIGIGCLTTLRSFGGSVGVAIFNSILRSKQISDTPGAVTAAAISAGFTGADMSALVQAALSGSAERISEAAGGDAAVIAAVSSAVATVLANSYRYGTLFKGGSPTVTMSANSNSPDWSILPPFHSALSVLSWHSSYTK